MRSNLSRWRRTSRPLSHMPTRTPHAFEVLLGLLSRPFSILGLPPPTQWHPFTHTHAHTHTHSPTHTPPLCLLHLSLLPPPSTLKWSLALLDLFHKSGSFGPKTAAFLRSMVGRGFLCRLPVIVGVQLMTVYGIIAGLLTRTREVRVRLVLCRGLWGWFPRVPCTVRAVAVRFDVAYAL